MSTRENLYVKVSCGPKSEMVIEPEAIDLIDKDCQVVWKCDSGWRIIEILFTDGSPFLSLEGLNQQTMIGSGNTGIPKEYLYEVRIRSSSGLVCSGNGRVQNRVTIDHPIHCSTCNQVHPPPCTRM